MGDPKDIVTYINEHSKVSIILGLFPQPFLCHCRLANIRGISQSELSRRIEEDVPSPSNDFPLFSSPNINHFKQVSVASAQIENISKDFTHKSVDTTSEGWRANILERVNKDLADMHECLSL